LILGIPPKIFYFLESDFIQKINQEKSA